MDEKKECPPGYEYVSSYRKEDGTYVKGYCREMERNPAVDEINRNYREEKRRLKEESKLRSYGTPVKGGYVMTAGQLQNYFRDSTKKKRRR